MESILEIYDQTNIPSKLNFIDERKLGFFSTFRDFIK